VGPTRPSSGKGNIWVIVTAEQIRRIRGCSTCGNWLENAGPHIREGKRGVDEIYSGADRVAKHHASLHVAMPRSIPGGTKKVASRDAVWAMMNLLRRDLGAPSLTKCPRHARCGRFLFHTRQHRQRFIDAVEKVDGLKVSGIEERVAA
jgi:hypothetical protein